MPLNTRCGQRGLCNGCYVELVRGSLIHKNVNERLATDGKPIELRGCEYCLPDDGCVEIRLPAQSLLAHEPQVVTDFRSNVPYAHDPLVDVGSADAEHPPIGAAIDIGTTTVVVMLVDLTDDRTLATSSAFNDQVLYGDNVLTRINLCRQDAESIALLQRAVIDQTISPLLEQSLSEAGATSEQLACLSVAGNTTMLHLLIGEDPSSMGVAPFTPGFLEHRVMSCGELGLEVAPAHRPIHLLPGAAAYVGSDLTAGVFSSGMAYRDETCLLVDVGTNGEIILKHGDHLLGCATAAGPAFEGSKLTCGLRAGRGAISHLWFDNDPTNSPPAVEVIGGGKPNGVCGTAYIDFLSEARRRELIGPNGRFVNATDTDRLIDDRHGGRAFVIADGQGREPIVISESDIASLLQAKAAIAAGIVCLLNSVDLQPDDVDVVFLAGGFGMHLNIDNVIGCGLLPGFAADRVQLVGNTSLAGAYLAMIDRGVLDEIKRICERIEIIELNLDPNFESNYIDQLSLPALAPGSRMSL